MERLDDLARIVDELYERSDAALIESMGRILLSAAGNAQMSHTEPIQAVLPSDINNHAN